MNRRLLAVTMLAACSSDGAQVKPADASDMPTGDPCNGHIIKAALTAAPHVMQSSPVEWSTNPPTSGPHYPVWAKWDRQYTTLPRGNWVHNLEHGGVVFAYRCDAGNCETAATLARIANALPDDPACVAPIRHRALVVLDQLLPSDGDVAAVAWGTYYIGTCADETSLAAFYTARFGRAPEDFCTDGSSALGGEPF